MTQFTAKFFSDNRQKLLEQVESELVVIAANAELQRSGDTSFPFRQDSNFWYLTGLNEPNLTLVITRQGSYIIKPYRHWVKDRFDGPLDNNQLAKVSGVDQVLERLPGWKKLTKQLEKHKKVATLFPMLDRHFNVTANPARRQVIGKMKRRVPSIHMEDARLVLARMRMIKQSNELAAIQTAIDATVASVKDVFSADWYKKYGDEYELDIDLSAGFRKHGADGDAFPSIVAAGEHAYQIHNMKNQGPLRNGELLLIDLGAEVNNYASDLARTFIIGKKPTKRQQEIFDAVKETQAFAFSLIKPGVNIRDYEKIVEEQMGVVLKQLGIIKRVNRKAVRKYFPHATSHMVGLDVHDAADYAQPFAEDMVLAVEPGIYIAAEKIGVRIEDNVKITKTGIEILSHDLPTSLGGATI